MSKQFILIENSNQLKVFFKKYCFSHIPIVYDVYCQALLERKGQEFITINHELSYQEIVEIYHKTIEMGEFVSELFDKLNEKYFCELFGSGDIKLFNITSKYLLNYCLFPNVFHAMNGLLRILVKNKLCNLYYFSFNIEKDIFSSWVNTDYFCPKRILPFFLPILKSSNGIACIELNDVISYEKYTMSQLKERLLISMRKLFQRLTLTYSSARSLMPANGQKYILATSTGYHLMPAIKNLLSCNKILKMIYYKKFIIFAEVHDRVVAMIENTLDIPNKKAGKIDNIKLNYEITNEHFGLLKSQGIVLTDFEKDLLKKLIIILEKFISKNIHNMINVWKNIRELDSIYNFEALVWDSPPITNYRNGMISEYFRLNNKLRIGIQHGGAYGSKDYGYAHFVSDYENCEYYFGYGYSNMEIAKAFPKRKSKAQILIKNNKQNKNNCVPIKESVKIIYVIPFAFETVFFQCTRPVCIDEYSFELQKIIVRKLSKHCKEKIILKFPPSHYDNHALKVFLDTLEHSFIIETEPFVNIIEKYSAEYIIMDIASQPLEQSLYLSPNSKLLVYDNPCAPFTNDALCLLSNRAVVTSDTREFIGYIDFIFSNTFPDKDIYNNEYMNKYGKFPAFIDSEDIQELFALHLIK